MEVIRSAAHEDFSFSDFKSVFNMVSIHEGYKTTEHRRFKLLFFRCQLKNQENLPNDKPVLTAYTRVSGQEWFFLNINKDLILKIIEVRGGRDTPRGSNSPVNSLLKGCSMLL